MKKIMGRNKIKNLLIILKAKLRLILLEGNLLKPGTLIGDQPTTRMTDRRGIKIQPP
jgi:hypothetical protein